MAGVNKIILVGNLGKDPEVNRLENGRAVATFSLATSETYKNKQGEKVTKTEWHNIVAWTPFAEIAEKFLKKGNQVYLEGKSTTRSWEAQNGDKRYTTEVIVNNMTLLSGNNSNRPPQHAESDIPASIANPEGEDSDDLPF